MVSYNNGFIPDNILLTFGSGYSPGEGNWKHQLSVGTYVKHKALVDLAKKNTGKVLAVSPGWSAYRPYSAQVYARQKHGNGAADPGESSHGGFWEGRQTLAMDYGNWSYVYNGDRAAFYRDVRAVGLTPGMISPERGYPDEPWHVIDLSPWSAPSGGGSSPTPETPKEIYMKPLLFQLDPNIDGRWVVVNVLAGTFWVAGNGTQLDFLRNTSSVSEVSGAQPPAVLQNMKSV